MQSYHNLEKSGFRPGEYVAWDEAGERYRVRRNGRDWRAVCQTSTTHKAVSAPTLRGISLKLSSLAR